MIGFYSVYTLSEPKGMVMIMRSPVFIQRIFRTAGGQATLEFVLVIPVIIMIMLAVSQFGHMVYRNNILQQAAREGVRVISCTNSNKLAIQAVVRVCGSEDDRIPDITIYIRMMKAIERLEILLP
jgi:uncharacterized protein (UPF0333 family)